MFFFLSDGATASGLLVATSFIVELINTDDVCDVCLAVRTIRQFRKEFIRDRVSADVHPDYYQKRLFYFAEPIQIFVRSCAEIFREIET